MDVASCRRAEPANSDRQFLNLSGFVHGILVLILLNGINDSHRQLGFAYLEALRPAKER